MTPTADDGLVHSLFESAFAQTLGERLVLHVARHVANHVKTTSLTSGPRMSAASSRSTSLVANYPRTG